MQEEFFHTFNTLYEAKKQIVLTSDRPPRDIATLEDRLKTRFEWGLTADVQAPDFETRIAIISRKAESLQFDIPEAVCEFIANKLKSNIRQLEGAVKKLRAYHLLEGKPINVATAQAAISDIINNSQPTPVTVDKIIEEVARTYGGITPEDIRSQKRNSNISKARQVSMYIVREITQMSMVEIGQTFGGRDHSTVIYAIHQVEKDLKKDSHTKAMVDDIIKIFGTVTGLPKGADGMLELLSAAGTYLEELNGVSILFRLALAMGLGGILGIERGKKRPPRRIPHLYISMRRLFPGNSHRAVYFHALSNRGSRQIGSPGDQRHRLFGCRQPSSSPRKPRCGA